MVEKLPPPLALLSQVPAPFPHLTEGMEFQGQDTEHGVLPSVNTVLSTPSNLQSFHSLGAQEAASGN